MGKFGPPPASTTQQGKVRLAGDLGGTASSPKVAGLSNPTSGIAPIHTGFTAFGTGGLVNITSSTAGSNTTPVAGSIYWAAAFIPMNIHVTGAIFTIGSSSSGTDKVIIALYSATGTLLANTATAGTTVGTASTKQKIAFTAAVDITGPDVYYLALQFNGTAARFMTLGNLNEGIVTGSTTGTFGTLPSITPGAAYTQNIGPFASTY